MTQSTEREDRVGSTVQIEIVYTGNDGHQIMLESANITLEDSEGDLIEVDESRIDLRWRIVE